MPTSYRFEWKLDRGYYDGDTLTVYPDALCDLYERERQDWERTRPTLRQIKEAMGIRTASSRHGGKNHLDREAILAKVDILDLVGRLCGPPRRAGARCVALCPWHDDKRPSMTIYADRGRVWCHACGHGGTAVDMVMQTESCDFLTALRILDGMY